MRKIAKITLTAMLVATMVVALVGPASAERILKIGVLAPFTGPSAKSGKNMKVAAKMAFEGIDYKIGDYKIELVYIDSQSDPAKAANAYAEAVDRLNVQATVFCWHSSTSTAVIDLAAHYRVPGFGTMGTSMSVVDKYKKIIAKDPSLKGIWLKGWPVPDVVQEAYMIMFEDLIKKGVWKPKRKAVAIYGEDTDWGRNVGRVYREYYTKYGWEIVSEDYFPFTQMEFYPLLSKYKKSGATLLAGTSTNFTSFAAFIKQAREIGIKAPIVADGLGYSGEWYSLLGRVSDGVIDMRPLFASPRAKEFAKKVEAKIGFAPGAGTFGIPYDWCNFFIKVLNRALEQDGKLDKETIHRVMREEVVTGKMTYTEAEGALIHKSYQFSEKSLCDPVAGPEAFMLPIVQYKSGKPKVIFPESWKEIEPILK